MSVATLTSPTETYVSPLMTAEAVVPKALIYEMVEGQPIYYRGWQSVLRGEKTIEQVMVAELGQKWEIQNWTESVEVVDGCTFNVQEMIDDFVA